MPVLIGVLGSVGLLPANGANADTIASLPISSYWQMAVDVPHGHIFISQGSSGQNGILVTDLTGKVVTTITGQTGVYGIALSPDGATLYAALRSAHAVTAISTTTLQQTASYPIGNANSPMDVAVQRGMVWVSYDTGLTGQAAIGDIDVSAVSPSFHTQAAMGGWSYAPFLAADPKDTGVLVAADSGTSPTAVASFDVTVDPATVRARSTLQTTCYGASDLAVVPGGAEVILACGAPYLHYRYRTADLSQLGSYASGIYPAAVAVDASGVVAAGVANGPAGKGIFVYQPNGGALLNSYDLASSGYILQRRGLALRPDGSQLFAVVRNGVSTGSYFLQVIDKPAIESTMLSISAPPASYITRPVTLTGSLTPASGAPLPAGTPVTITRSVAGGTSVKTFAVATAANGSVTLTDTPPALGQYLYRASYSGSTTTTASTALTSVTVTRIPASLTLTAGSATRNYLPAIQVTAHLGATYTNRTVSLYAQPFGSKTRTLLKAAKVNSSGNLTISYLAPHSTTFSAVFSGDAHYAAVTLTTAVSVQVRVSESVSGYYGSKVTGGTTYRLYHKANKLYALATIAPNKAGHCATFRVQEYVQGTWIANVTSACTKLSATSHAAGYFVLTGADLGVPYRIRADYAADATNSGSSSAWIYLMVEP